MTTFLYVFATPFSLLNYIALRITTDHKSVQALKARILLSFPDIPRQKQGRDDINALLERNPPVADIQTIVILEECLRQTEATDAEIDLIWERAVRVRPQDEELQTIWFKKNFEKQRWKGAQKVCYFTHLQVLRSRLRQVLEGVNGSTEELSQGETILFLGDCRQLSGRNYPKRIRHGPTTLRRVGIQAAFQSCLRCSCRYCESRPRLQAPL